MVLLGQQLQQQGQLGAAPGPAAGAGGWRLSKDAVEAVPDFNITDLLEAESMPVSLPEDKDAAPMTLFASRAVQSWGAPDTDTLSVVTTCLDSVTFAGSLVWALDWCPLVGDAAAAQRPLELTEVLAAALHPKDQRRNLMGQAVSGPGLIQLWAVPASATAAGSDSEGVPRPLACLLHEGRLAWDVKWCPDPRGFLAAAPVVVTGKLPVAPSVVEQQKQHKQAQLAKLLGHKGLAKKVPVQPGRPAMGQQQGSGAAGQEGAGAGGAGTSGSGSTDVPVMGLLAAPLADGSVHVYAVPSMDHLQQLHQQQQQANGSAGSSDAAANRRADGAGPSNAPPAASTSDSSSSSRSCPSVRLKPLISISAEQMAGSITCCCEWHPAPPHELLLLGCFDGVVAVWRLPRTPGGSAELMLRIIAEVGPVRAVQWKPVLPAPGSAPAAKRARTVPATTATAGTSAAASDAAPAATTTAAPSTQTASTSTATAAANPQPSNNNANNSSSSSSSFGPFVTAGFRGDMHVWDPQSPLGPVLDKVLQREVINSLLWLPREEPLMVAALDDGSVRIVPLLPTGKLKMAFATVVQRSSESATTRCMWSLDYCAHDDSVALCGDDGVIGLMQLSNNSTHYRMRRPLAALAAIVVIEGEAKVLTAEQIPGNAGMFAGTRSFAPAVLQEMSKPLSTPLDDRQSMPCLRFSKAYHGGTWLAVGSGAGLLRIMRVSTKLAM